MPKAHNADDDPPAPRLRRASFGDANEVVYYHQNTLFSVYAVSDASQSVVERYRYDAYGGCGVLDADGSADADGLSDVGNPYAFTGRRLDPESALMQYRHRCYSPTLGRFISRDPAESRDSSCLYDYASQRPTSATDPDGLQGRVSLPPWKDYPAGARDYGWQVHQGILGLGTAWVTCYDENCKKHTRKYRKRCIGAKVGLDLSHHVLEGLNGKDCPDGYKGIFWEVDVPIPKLYILGATLVYSGAARILGGGLSVGFSIGVTRCCYDVADDPSDDYICADFEWDAPPRRSSPPEYKPRGEPGGNWHSMRHRWGTPQPLLRIGPPDPEPAYGDPAWEPH